MHNKIVIFYVLACYLFQNICIINLLPLDLFELRMTLLIISLLHLFELRRDIIKEYQY